MLMEQRDCLTRGVRTGAMVMSGAPGGEKLERVKGIEPSS
jgi:hypothetical protein